MRRIILTGADGFLGWHLRVRMRALTDCEVIPITRGNIDAFAQLTDGAEALIHVAGINRGSDEEVESGNRALAEVVADALSSGPSIRRVVFANSIHAGNGTAYGTGKQLAAAILAKGAARVGADFVDVRLPNLFGEHARPHYNSFVATFVDAILKGQVPTIADREIDLLHVQEAAASLLEAVETSKPVLSPMGTPASVHNVWMKLLSFHQAYGSGAFPPLKQPFDVSLFNTFRAACFPSSQPISLSSYEDDRGQLVDAVRSGGGQGQVFASTTHPGITRGEHFHLEKVERFIVLSGRARIALRRVLTEEVVAFDVDGDRPVAVDMPTMWVHNITNVGDTELLTLFWAHTIYDAEAPDTYWEPVEQLKESA